MQDITYDLEVATMKIEKIEKDRRDDHENRKDRGSQEG